MTAIPIAQFIPSVFGGVLYVLHAFQKKSRKGIATPAHEIDLIKQRLALAERDYKQRLN